MDSHGVIPSQYIRYNSVSECARSLPHIKLYNQTVTKDIVMLI